MDNPVLAIDTYLTKFGQQTRRTNMTPNLKTKISTLTQLMNKLHTKDVEQWFRRELLYLWGEINVFYNNDTAFVVPSNYNPQTHINKINELIDKLNLKYEQFILHKKANLEQHSSSVGCDNKKETDKLVALVKKLLTSNCLTKTQVVDAVEKGMQPR